MSQNENVLPAAIVRAIGDKLYDRRKTAALEVEGLVKNLAAQVVSMLPFRSGQQKANGQITHFVESQMGPYSKSHRLP